MAPTPHQQPSAAHKTSGEPLIGVCPHPNQGGAGEHQIWSPELSPLMGAGPPNSHLHQAVAGKSTA